MTDTSTSVVGVTLDRATLRVLDAAAAHDAIPRAAWIRQAAVARLRAEGRLPDERRPASTALNHA